MPSRPTAGPAIYGVDPWARGHPKARHQLFSDDERALLAKISSIVRFRKGETIYEAGADAEAAFNVISGIVMTYRALADGEHVSSFLNQGDLFGLAEEGCYTNSARAVTPIVAYRIPVPALRRLLNQHADLDVGLIIKLCEDLREAQHHALLLARKRAVTRLAMFLELLERLQIARDEPDSEIHVPMGRSSIAAYLAVTPAALSRALHTLIVRNIISTRDRRHVRILDRETFQKLADTRSSEN
jgi:CRP-like cAMP-binding protein